MSDSLRYKKKSPTKDMKTSGSSNKPTSTKCLFPDSQYPNPKSLSPPQSGTKDCSRKKPPVLDSSSPYPSQMFCCPFRWLFFCRKI